MKKLILSAALVLGTFAASAQTTPATTTTSTETTTTKTAPAQDEIDVKIADVPAPVMTAVKAGYPGAVVNSVTVNGAKEYTINLTSGDKTGLVYADANGKWIKKD